ncbi:hypothetical protein FQN57_000115 [Myotisia sp. PD_48]|nr:hypothetical protein FQN57_000115 [Myotisia sp. PD_48]
MFRRIYVLSTVIAVAVAAVAPQTLASCPGYTVSHVHEKGNELTASLQLAGDPCNTYGEDIDELKLRVEYQSHSRLHVSIYDAKKEVYQIPKSVFPRPSSKHQKNHMKQKKHKKQKKLKNLKAREKPALKFSYKSDPFSFSIVRRSTNEVLFDTSGSNLIFQSQYLNLRTFLPAEPNLYGLGEHSDQLRLSTKNNTRTLWNRDAFAIPPGSNLYGSHPVYFDHRGEQGTHGVFLLNSNGMDIKIGNDQDNTDKKYLEYNTLGGVFDFYFLAGPTPIEVASQYADIVGLPAMMPYWGLGFHQCRYGYRDAFAVAEVVQNYSSANIPLETMWTDIDYMDGRKVFTLDQERFPIEKMRALVNSLHERDQHYIVMVDPAVSYGDNPAFDRGVEQDVFLKLEDGTIYKAAVWPGVTAFPDWFHPKIQKYWNNEFELFFDKEKGVDIDALWIDMNEAANFCEWPCLDPEAWERDHNLPPNPPPVRQNPRPLPQFPPIFQPPKTKRYVTSIKPELKSRNLIHPPRPKRYFTSTKSGLKCRDLIDPPYRIDNKGGSLSNRTLHTDLIHANGLTEYDTHNLYGSMMSIACRRALLKRRPTKRPLVITRSTFAGAGAHVGHWLGDNLSEWSHYRFSIAQMLSFAAIFQIPMVGSDVCGFAGNTTEELCARWAMLGAFSPFYRNHNDIAAESQEFYRWESVTKAAQTAIDIRYRLLDYIYTAFHQQAQSGEPMLNPLFYLYPNDENTFGLDLQFFYGNAILVSPVTEQGSTSVEIYLPDDIFYDFYTGVPVRGNRANITLSNVGITQIPLHIRGGTIIPIRSRSSYTTKELRNQPFELIIAPDLGGKAAGKLYIDDGESLKQTNTIEVDFKYHAGKLSMEGKFDFPLLPHVKIAKVRILGAAGGKDFADEEIQTVIQLNTESDMPFIEVNLPLTGPATMELQ